MFNHSNHVSISGGRFICITGQEDQKGIHTLREHTAPGAFHNSAERYDPPKCHPDTRVAVIQEIIDWIEDGQKTSFIKWLHGSAGVGKSAIAQEIAEWCHESGCLGASFFWSRNAAGRNNETRLIATLAYQLLVALPEMRSHVEIAIETDPSLLSRSLAAQMEKLIVEPLKKAFGNDNQGHRDTKVIVLDGLDECGTPESQQYILKIIATSVHKFVIPLVILIASRPEQVIRDSFNNHPLLPITSSLRLDEKYHPDDDIRLFLVESFESVKRTHALRGRLPCVWPTDIEIDELVRRASGQFIYAATVIKFIRSARRKPDKQLDIILGITAAGKDSPFGELDALYCQIFGVVEDIPRALEVLSCILFTDVVLDMTASEVEEFLSYTPGDLQLILIDLHSVVNVPAIPVEGESDKFPFKNHLSVPHASLQEFLLDPARSGDFYIDKGKAHASIAQHSLRYLRNCSQAPLPDQPQAHLNYCRTAVVLDLRYQCINSCVTREQAVNFLDFDFGHWISEFLTSVAVANKPIDQYKIVVSLYTWIQKQTADIEGNLDLRKTRFTYRPGSWAADIDLACEYVCRRTVNEFPQDFQDAFTAITHPQIAQYSSIHPLAFHKVVGVYFFISSAYKRSDDEVLIPLRKYLLDAERGGRCFVDRRRYTALSVRFFKFISASAESEFENEAPEDEGSEDEELEDEEWKYEKPEGNELGKKSLKFAIGTLPFYLSNAIYTPELVALASLVPTDKILAKDSSLDAEISLLRDAIKQYLIGGPTNSPQEQFDKSAETALIDQPHNLEPEEATDRTGDLFQHCVRGKKRRMICDDSERLALADSTISSESAPLAPPSKRLRITDMLNPSIG